MNIIEYLGKSYKNPPCWLLVSDVFHKELGFIPEDFTPNSCDAEQISRAFRLAIHNADSWATRVDKPSDFSIVLMARTERREVHHAGVYYNGGVLHAQDRIVSYQPLGLIKDQFKKIEYWNVNDSTLAQA